MGHLTLAGKPPIAVTLRRSARARRLSLRVSRLDGQVSLTLPVATPETEGIAFLESKADWLRTQLAHITTPVPAAIGGSVMVAGEPRAIVAGSGRHVRQVGTTLEVAASRPVGPQLRAYLRHAARNALAAASDTHAAALGLKYTRITLRDTRSRWGSCTSGGALMYSWRLIMAPPAVLDYVAAHEVAHLREMNHGAAFWRLVADLCPDYVQHRQWLRQHGDLLHRVTFDD